MGIALTDNDIAVLNSLLKNGRKSFRQISREIGISTPAVKSRFDRLLNMGVIKSVSPILDLDKISYKSNTDSDRNAKLGTIIQHTKQEFIGNGKAKHSGIKMDRGLSVKISCDYCKIPLFVKMFALKIANFERFFCCKECRVAYKKRYAGRIDALTKGYHKTNRGSA